MSNYLFQENQWKEKLSKLSNTELIERFNQEIPKKGWTSSRGLWLSLCISEMKNRNWNVEAICGSDKSEPYSSFMINHEIILLNQTVILKNA